MNNWQTATVQERRKRETVLVLLAVPAIVLGAWFLYFIGQDALIGRHPFQFFADSNTYHDIYSGVMRTPDGFIGVSYNFLGPLIILTLLGGNIYFVLVINVAIFIISMIAICRMLDIDPLRAASIQLVSPLTMFSLLSVNKEILIFPVLMLLIAAYRSRSIFIICIAILASLLARWQLTAFCITLTGLFFFRKINPYLIIALLMVTISFAYYAAQGILDPVLRSVEVSTSVYTEGSGLFERLNELQNEGLYFAVAPIKAAHLLFSLGLRIQSIFNPIVIYNDQVVGLFCLVNIVFFAILALKRRLSPRNDLIMISFVYLIVFALTPVYAPRYFHPVTVLWAFVLAGGSGAIQRRAAEGARETTSVAACG